MPHDDFAVEPIPGLPEMLPEGEEMLWQGKPDALALAREALALRWVLGYFVLLAALRSISLIGVEPLSTALAAGLPFLLLGAGVGIFLYLFAWVQAKNTIYTITSRRVVMRIGAAITMNLNLPYRWIESADLMRRRDGTGTIYMKLKGDTRIAYLGAWPHVRPWAMKHPEPALRAIPDVARVAAILGEAAETCISEPQIARTPAEAVVAAE